MLNPQGSWGLRSSTARALGNVTAMEIFQMDVTRPVFTHGPPGGKFSGAAY